MSIVRCPHCGTANRAGSNFCNGCGTDLRNPDSPAPSAAESPAPADPLPPSDLPESTQVPDTPRTPDASGADDADTESSYVDQPWLRLEFDTDEPLPPGEGQEGQGTEAEGRGRLVTGIQGLLTPIRIATNIGDRDPVQPTAPTTPDEIAAGDLRLVRGLMAESPSLVNYQVPTTLANATTLRVGWIAGLLLLAIGLPALLRIDGLRGTPNHWPGVDAAFAAVQATAPDAPVLVLWAYDPATSGELDLPMAPVMRHLLAQRTRPAVVSLLPGGMASARRLIAQVRSAPGPGGLAQTADLGRPVTYTYVPGGAAVLPLLVRDPAAAGIPPTATSPDLIVVAAAQAEDVQQWLEQVQPLAPGRVVAVTSAGADPILRPYLASGQLAGLVSGFDGAYAYRSRLDPFVAPESAPRLAQQITLQNWGHLAILAVIVLGNLAALMGRGPGD